MVTLFPLDYMHLVCLGVTRRVLMVWLRSPVNRGLRLGQTMICQLSESLRTFTKYIPREFSRKCRSLQEIERWKATEFRQFLLYSGVVAMKGRISDMLYDHFLLLSVGIHCLVSPHLCKSHADYAHDLLCRFVNEAKDIYGLDFLVYNVHGLTHIASDVKIFGPLDSYSAFPFENFLRHLKLMVRKPQSPLQQIVRRISERAQQGIFEITKCNKILPNNVSQKQHVKGPVQAALSECQQFEKIMHNDIFLSVHVGDNCVKIHNNFYFI